MKMAGILLFQLKILNCIGCIAAQLFKMFVCPTCWSIVPTPSVGIQPKIYIWGMQKCTTHRPNFIVDHQEANRNLFSSFFHLVTETIIIQHWSDSNTPTYKSGLQAFSADLVFSHNVVGPVMDKLMQNRRYRLFFIQCILLPYITHNPTQPPKVELGIQVLC